MTEPPYLPELRVVPEPPPAAAGPHWVKSSRSQAQNNNCVELAAGSAGVVAVRDSKDRDGAVLTFSPRAWREFVSAVKGL